MASSASDLIKFEKQANGENSGTWGTLANKAMSRIEEAIAGYSTLTIAGSTYTLDDTQYVEFTGTTAQSHLAILKAIGTPGAKRTIVVPGRTKTYLIWNICTTYDVNIDTASDNGGVDIPTGYMAYVVCDGTNVEFASALVSPAGAINMNGNHIYDANGAELLKFTETASAVNELVVGNNSAGNNPTITATGGDTNVGINFVPKGTGLLQNNGASLLIAGKQTAWIPSAAMRPTSSNGCAVITDIETTAGRPDLQVLDFDSTADEHAQFQIMFPKTWNLGTVTFQAAWTSTATDTDGVSWGIQGVVCSDSDTIDVAYGTAIVVDDANISAAEDFYLTAESSAVTIGGTPADNDITFFRVFRDVSDSNDTAAEDARLIGVKLFFTTDSEDDT
jgi:hypothetical protein